MNATGSWAGEEQQGTNELECRKEQSETRGGQLGQQDQVKVWANNMSGG